MGRPGRRKRNNRKPSSSVKVTRTSGTGANKTTSSRTAGLSIVDVGPTGKVSAARPTIRATVRERGGELSKKDIKLYLDGSQKTGFHYDPSSGRLSLRIGRKLAPGIHRVEIEAEAESGDDKGRTSGKSRKRWTFTVSR